MPSDRLAAPLVAVVGGGISGLTVAWRLVTRPDPPRVVVLEAGHRLGGKLRTGAVGPVEVDLGAESVLARRPEAVDLIRDAGLAQALTHPVTAVANVVRDGALHPLPAGTLMGVPGRIEPLRGLLTDTEVARIAAEPGLPPTPVEHDVDIASWVRARMGRAVVDHLVEPLLGGVYAGHARLLSLQATVPALWRQASAGGSLLEGIARSLAPTPGHEPAGAPGAPVFAGVTGGLGRLPAALAATLLERGVTFRTGTPVRGLERSASGWRLVVGPGSAREAGSLTADAVVLAVPPAPARELLAGVCPAGADELAAVETASVAIVALAVPRQVLAGVPGSGVLVPPVEGRPVKAMTFSSAKWAWVGELDPELAVVRLSLGRHREEAVLQRDDGELTALAVADAEELLRRPLAPVASRVVRWDGSLPQPMVGHAGRIERLRAAVDRLPGLAVCGAAVDGVGIPACIAAATRAADKISEDRERIERMSESTAQGRVIAREINETIRYTMWSVFAADQLPAERRALVEEVEQLLAGLAGKGLEIRGWYDVAGLRADADAMVWWHAPTPETLQEAYHALRRTALGRRLRPVWSVMALHRPAEFNKGHVPAFMAGEQARGYVCVYPFVRSYEWYLLPETERRDLLVEHGKAARGYPDVRANTVSAFALGDYEWVLAFEADELHRIVDLMRELRATQARRHVREEIPFYTGPRLPLADLVATLPGD